MRQFPVLMSPSDRKAYPDCPASVPWDYLAPYEARARQNHNQTLERLAERGGLSPSEMYLIVNDLGLWSTRTHIRLDAAWLTALVNA